MKRRDFIRSSVATTLALSTLPSQIASARGPIERSGPSRLRVGLAAYSLRDYFSFKKGKDQTPANDGQQIDMVGFLDYCVQQNVEAAELTSYFFKPNADDEYFLNLKRQAYIRGVTISGTAIGNNFTIGKGDKLDVEVDQAIKWIDRAAILGAPHIRFFAGKGREIQNNPGRLDEACDALNHCAKHAAKNGIFLGVENHGNLTPKQMLAIMERANSPWIGINLDTGNFVSDDPYGDLEKCIDYAVNVQVKVSMKAPNGKKYPADLKRIGKIPVSYTHLTLPTKA